MSTSPRRPGRPPQAPEVEAAQRQRILAASARVFANRGFHATDVQEIADAAGLGKASVYRRWGTKEDLFRATVADGAARMMQHVMGSIAAAPDPLARLRAGVRAYLGWWDANPDLMELLMMERTEFRGEQRARILRERERADAEARAVFGELIAAGLIRDLPADRLCQAIGDHLYGLIYFDRLVGRRRPVDQQADEVVDLFLHGILTPAGRRRAAPIAWEANP